VLPWRGFLAEVGGVFSSALKVDIIKMMIVFTLLQCLAVPHQ